MFFNSLKKKLHKSYSNLNKEIRPKVFPNGEAEYIYVGTILDALFKKRDVFKLIQIYASVYTYYKLELGNCYTTFTYAKKNAAGVLSDYECKTLIGLVMLNTTSNKTTFSNPIEQVDRYRGFVIEYLNTVEGIEKNLWRFETEPISAGTVNSPLLVAGICGLRKYIGDLKIPGVEKISYSRTSALSLTNERCNVGYTIDEYTLTNAATGAKIASLWFNIYGTQNTNVQPVCFSDKTPFSAAAIAPKLFAEGISQWQSIEEICKELKINFDHRKLVISTFVYFYVIWSFSFKNLRLGQSTDLEEKYLDLYLQYNKEVFDSLPYRQVLENEQIIKDMVKRVDKRVRTTLQANNQTIIDDGLTDEFIFEFTNDHESAAKIKAQVMNKLMIEWISLGQEADEKYLT